MNPYNFSSIFFGFGFFFVAVFVVMRRTDKVGVLYGVYSFFVVAWAIPFSIMIGDGISYDLALLCSRLCCLFALFIGATWLHFCVAFTDNSEARLILFCGYGVAFTVGLFAFSDLFIPTVKPILSFDYYTRPGPLYHFFTFAFIFCVAAGFWVLHQSSKHAMTTLARKNLNGLIFASVYGYVGGSLTFLPVYQIEFPQYGIFLMPLYPFFMAFFITRTNLFSEVEVVTAAHKDKLATIGTLAASLNHEIKNPLYVIQGLVQSFRQNRSENLYQGESGALQAAEDVMVKAEQQIQRTVEIMKNFSAFAKQKIDAAPSISVVDAGNLLARIVPLLRYELELEKITIQNRIATGEVVVSADERYLEEILFNLIMNSCQAMKNTGGEIVISAKESSGKVIFEISDNGPGIPKEQQKQIFEPFYTTKDEGTGLGLYITKQLVERIGGKITLNPEVGQGTVFLLELKKA